MRVRGDGLDVKDCVIWTLNPHVLCPPDPLGLIDAQKDRLASCDNDINAKQELIRWNYNLAQDPKWWYFLPDLNLRIF
jgi:hypothetical protein